MYNINLDDGLEKIIINGDEERAIFINVTDFNIVDRWYEVKENITKLGQELPNEMQDELPLNPDGSVEEESLAKYGKLIKDLDTSVKEQINYLFNANVTEQVFKGSSAFAVKDGEFYVTRFLNSILPVIQNVINKESENMEKKISKHTAKYDNMSAEAKKNYDKLIADTTKVEE